MDYNKIRATWWSGTCYHKEQLEGIIANTDIKNYAYILHDKDKAENGDEFKKPHYHFLIHLHQKQRGSWFKMFATDDMGIVFAQPCFAPQGAYDYLIHDTPTARKQGKYLYDPTERTSTIDTFDVEEKIDENAELYNDLMDLLVNKITWHEFIQKKPKRIHMIANIRVAFEMLFLETYGYRYFEVYQNPKYFKQQNQTLPPPEPKPTPPKIELVPIADDKDMPW
jgi:hypothetical protein